MGYFSNSSDGMGYEDQYCSNCVHMNKEYGCPCWDIHMLYNYEECNNKESILHKMIPMDAEGTCGKCIHYVRKE